MRFKGLPYLVVASSLAFAQPKPAEPSFEVASIKPSPPRTTGPMVTGFNGGPGTASPTRATFTRFRLGALISFAYDLKTYQFDYLTNPRLQDELEVTVNIPDGATRDQFRAMTRRLLAERFHLVAHFEKRSTDVYDLVQAKGGHKLKPPTIADAPPATFVMPEKGADGLPKIPAGQSSQICAFDGCRMQLIGEGLDRLINQLGGELKAPIVDRTGLTGKFDYTVSWSSGPSNAADAPPMLGVAINDQLGLRVEKRKGEIDFLVIDSVDRTATEN